MWYIVEENEYKNKNELHSTLFDTHHWKIDTDLFLYINETKTFPNKDTHVTYLHLYNGKDIDLR